jgi:hypothetical protein
MPTPGYYPLTLASVVYGPRTVVTGSSTSSSTPTALDTTNLRATFTAPPSGIVWVFYSCMTLKPSPAGGVLCLAEGSTVVSSVRVATRVAAPGGGYIDVDPSEVFGSCYVETNDTVSGLGSGTHHFDLAVMGYSGQNVTAGYGGPDGGMYGCAVIEVYGR